MNGETLSVCRAAATFYAVQRPRLCFREAGRARSMNAPW